MRTWHEPCTSVRLDRCGIQLAVAHSFNTQLSVVTILDEPGMNLTTTSAVFPPFAQTCTMDARVDSDDEDDPGPPVPVTILTGFLGAGKTSLLRHVLTEPHGLKIAVVQNEMSAAVGLEEATVRGPNGEEFAEWMELANGCVCCAVRDDLVQCMEKLVKMKSFDYVLIETTGMADPGPVAASFWLDDALESPLRLDGIVTVVDGHNLSKQLGTLEACRQVSPCPSCGLLPLTQPLHCMCTSAARQPRGALRAQIASADCLLINKIDGLEPGHLVELEAHVRHLNPTAPMLRTEHSRVSVQAAARHPPALPPSLAPTLSLACTLALLLTRTCALLCAHPRAPLTLALHLVPVDPQPARLRCAAAPPRHTIRGRRRGVRTDVGPRSSPTSRRRRRR